MYESESSLSFQRISSYIFFSQDRASFLLYDCVPRSRTTIFDTIFRRIIHDQRRTKDKIRYEHGRIVQESMRGLFDLEIYVLYFSLVPRGLGAGKIKWLDLAWVVRSDVHKIIGYHDFGYNLPWDHAYSV